MTTRNGVALAVLALVAGCTTGPQKLNQHGIALYGAGKYIQAMGYFQQALEDDPENADVAFNLASCHHKIGDLAKAEATYRQVLGRAPDHAKAHRGLAVVLAEQGKRRAAQRLLDDFMERYPKQPGPWLEIGWFSFHDGDLARARGMAT